MRITKKESGMVSQPCEYTKKYQIVCSKWVDYIICELYFNKALKKRN